MSETYRIPRADICMSDAMPFHQHWEARAPLSIARLGDVGAALQVMVSAFRPGDLVHLCAYDSARFERLTEVASFRIAAIEDNRIKAVQIGQTASVPQPRPLKPVPPGEKLSVVQAGASFEVHDSKGNMIETFVERGQADAFAKANSGKAA